ncbi:hypothetical protein AAFC00_004443 [Neodothiora populina]|uniref:acetyl-CoA C-acyltransferase n=1 Tax=Neodothiora populina TaxID=2781224 RepID=A0ABR3P200_9PEZI
MASAQRRLASITSQIQPAKNSKDAVLRKNPDDIVITFAARTPLTKARKGAFKDTQLEDLMVPLLKALIEESNIDPSLVEDVCLGNVLHPGAQYVARAAVLAAGFPVTTASSVASRWCSSGLLSVQQIANQIAAGSIDVGVAIGAESMSTNPDGGAPKFSEQAMQSQVVKDTTMPMGWTSENVAGDFSISRKQQDEFAALSQQKAEKAQREGWTKDEIIPISVQFKDPKTGESKTIVADKDEGVRAGTTADGLAKIKPAFPQWNPSTTTGGNASQITDGAAAILLMKRSTAKAIGQPILAKFVGATVAGLEPRIMGIGPTVAIPKLLEKVGMALDDIDIVEINEAFSSMGVYCRDKLKISSEKLNPRGGAVALGHPLGCTGARQIVTALSELKRTDKKTAITSMCVGTGIGMAGLIVSEQ